MDELLAQIREADAFRLEILMNAVMERKKVLNPGWEIIYYAHKKGTPINVEMLLSLIKE